MKLLVTLILVLKILNSKLSNCEEMDAVIVVEPSNFINLENTTTYSVFCILTKGQPEVNSSHLSFSDTNILTENLNETTITAKVNVEQNAGCNSTWYHCIIGKPGKPRIFRTKDITIGRPPAVITPHDFICISEHHRYIHCQFPAKKKCDLATSYTLLTVSKRNEFSKCEWWLQGDTIHWDTRNGSCAFSMDDSYTRFELDVRNVFGANTMKFNITHENIVRLDKPNFLTATHVTATSAKVTWNMPELNLHRDFKYEFLLISENGVSDLVRLVAESKMISSYLVNDLIPHTNYTLKVRAYVVPEDLRPSNDLYWSESGSVTFQTEAHRPITAPTVAPGAYSFKKKSKDLMNVSVFWESIPEHLHNGTGFGYEVTAFSDAGYNLTVRVKISTYTFNNLPIGHYRIRVSSFNDKGISKTFNEMHIFPPLDDRQPQIRAVFKAGGYNVSWIAPQKANPTSYTLLYCHFTSQGTCHESTQFVTLPGDRTFFVTALDNALNFAVSANYADNRSSELSWQHCVVAPRTSQLGAPKYQIESVTADSMTVRMVGRCEEHSFYERIEIHVWTMEGQVVFNKSYDHFIELIDVTGLKSSTEYKVIVTAFDRFGKFAEEVTLYRTESNGIWLFISIIIVFGVAAIILISIVAIRKLRFVLDIKVDIPVGLLEDQEDSVDVFEPDDHPDYSYLTCPTIPEETELITEETHPSDPVNTAEEPVLIESDIAASSEAPPTRGVGGPYIEMLSWKQPLESDEPPSVDGNGNYEQMHPPRMQSAIVRSTGYVKMNLFINSARTGNYTQTIV